MLFDSIHPRANLDLEERKAVAPAFMAAAAFALNVNINNS